MRFLEFQSRVINWLVRCFDISVVTDIKERNFRFFEEATELVQAGGMTKDECLQLIDYVYGRPVGEVKQEVGGTLVTLFGLINAHGLDSEQCAIEEINSCHEHTERIRSKWLNKKIKGGPLP